MYTKEFVLRVEEIKGLVEKKLVENGEYEPNVEFIEHLGSYSVSIPALTRMGDEELKEAQREDKSKAYLDTIIVPALPRILKTEENLSSLQCRFSYSQSPCSISPTTHYDLLEKIYKFGRIREEGAVLIDRFCLRRLIDFGLGTADSEKAEILVSTKLRVGDQGKLSKVSPIRVLPINIKEGFPSVGFQFETYLTRSEIGLGPTPDAVLKMADSCFVLDEIKFGDLRLIRRCEIDAVRRRHVNGELENREKQNEYKKSLDHETWEQSIENFDLKEVDERLSPPCRVFLSGNLRSSKIFPSSRVEIKSISYRNLHNFSWVSVYFQMLIGSTPLLIRGCHNRGFFTQKSIASYTLEQVKEFSIKELGSKKREQLSFSGASWDTLTGAIAFSEAVLSYISNDLLGIIGSHLNEVLGLGDHFVNFTIQKKDDSILFRLLDPNDGLPNIPGPINYWNNFLALGNLP
ncbi:hypothetical protein HWI79_3768 [Cryptosporidium felis]|nr:hypothetical protein HWI79_3768 [Cryptosporidium felis]